MEFLGHLVRCMIEFAALGRFLITNSLNFLALCMKSRATLVAENLFLRKQLAFYQERKVVPRRFDNASRYLLVLLSRCFDWKDALVNIAPRTLIGWHRAGFRLFWRRPARLLEPLAARGLQGDLRALPGWSNQRPTGGLPDGFHRRRGEVRSVRTPRRASCIAGRLAARSGRRRKRRLAGYLCWIRHDGVTLTAEYDFRIISLRLFSRQNLRVRSRTRSARPGAEAPAPCLE